MSRLSRLEAKGVKKGDLSTEAEYVRNNQYATLKRVCVVYIRSKGVRLRLLYPTTSTTCGWRLLRAVPLHVGLVKLEEFCLRVRASVGGVHAALVWIGLAGRVRLLVIGLAVLSSLICTLSVGRGATDERPVGYPPSPWRPRVSRTRPGAACGRRGVAHTMVVSGILGPRSLDRGQVVAGSGSAGR